jgi:hypothetical protein
VSRFPQNGLIAVAAPIRLEPRRCKPNAREDAVDFTGGVTLVGVGVTTTGVGATDTRSEGPNCRGERCSHSQARRPILASSRDGPLGTS